MDGPGRKKAWKEGNKEASKQGSNRTYEHMII